MRRGVSHSAQPLAYLGVERKSASAFVRRSNSASDPMVIRMKSDVRGPAKCLTSTARSRSAAVRAWPVWLGGRAKTKLALDGRISNPSPVSAAVRASRFSMMVDRVCWK